MGAAASVETLEQDGFPGMEQRYRSLVATGAKDEELFEMLKAMLATQIETIEMQERLASPGKDHTHRAQSVVNHDAASTSDVIEEPKGPLALATSALASVTASLGLGGKSSSQKDSGEVDLIQNMSPVFTTDVLMDPIALRMFIHFCDKQSIAHGADRLRFWAEIEELHALPSHSYTLRRLRKIYDKFVSPEANSPVCVSSTMASDIAKALEHEDVSAGVYTEAQALSLRALEESVYPRFRESKLFRKMVEFCTPIDLPGGIGGESGGGEGHGGGGGDGTTNGSGNCIVPGGGVAGIVNMPELAVSRRPVTTENLNKSLRDSVSITEGLAGVNTGGGMSMGMKLNGALEDEYSLQEILIHPAKCRFLKSFCMQALALENLLFYLEVEDCKRLPNLSYISNKTRRIYDRYCQPHSKNFIEIESTYLEELHQANEAKAVLLPKMFIGAQTAVLERISDDLWPSFCRSNRYLNYTQQAQPSQVSKTGSENSGSRLTMITPRDKSEGESGSIPSGLSLMRFVDPLSVLRKINRDSGNADAWKQLEKLDELELIQIGMTFPAERLFTKPMRKTSSMMSRASVHGHPGNPDKGEGDDEEDLLAIILKDPYAKKVFHQFLQKRGTGDDAYLAVCEEIEEFKLLPGMEYLQLSAKKIYRKYMMPRAKLQVDMSTQMREEIANKLSNPTLDMFKKIVARVKAGMLQDSLPRFIKSSQYADLKKSLHKQHKNSGSSSARSSRESGGDGDDMMSVRIDPEEFAAIDKAAKSSKLEMSHLDLFLNNQTALHHFKLFMQVQHCSENLLLYEEVENFRRLPSYQIVVRSAKKLYDKYLAGNESAGRKASVRLVCVSQGARERVANRLENATRTTFDEIERECYEYIRQNLVAEFLDSRMFMALVGTWSVVNEDLPAEMLRGEFEMAFLRHRFHYVQETKGIVSSQPVGRKSVVMQQIAE